MRNTGRGYPWEIRSTGPGSGGALGIMTGTIFDEKQKKPK